MQLLVELLQCRLQHLSRLLQHHMASRHSHGQHHMASTHSHGQALFQPAVFYTSYASLRWILRNSTTTTTVLRPFFRDHPCEPVPEENFWTLWCKERLTEADTLTIRLGATPSGLTSAHLHHPQFFTGRMPFLPPNQQCQSTEGSSTEGFLRNSNMT